MNFPIIKLRKIWYTISGLALIASVVMLFVWGLKFSIDFTGGSLIELTFENNRPSVQEIQDSLANMNLGEVLIQPSGDKDVLIRLQNLTEEEHQQLLETLNNTFAPKKGETVVHENRYESVGPIVGKELKDKAILALIFAIIFIIAYIAYAFRKVSKPVESWKFGVTAILALIHDTLIIIGVFAFLGKFFNVEVGAMFATALLTILGFSVHDTIVVFDRTRENLFSNRDRSDFEEIVNKSVNQTIWRSINTSFSTLLVLGAVYFFGGESIKYFTLALILGIIVGTYSSIFIASPLIVDWYKLSLKKSN